MLHCTITGQSLSGHRFAPIRRAVAARASLARQLGARLHAKDAARAGLELLALRVVQVHLQHVSHAVRAHHARHTQEHLHQPPRATV